nr:MFS transporter [Actinokineospora inagensis]
MISEFRRAQLAVAALFCLLGFQYATWAAQIPALQSRMSLSPAELGVLLLATGVGATVSFPLVATLMRRLGSRGLACLSGLVLCLVLVALAAVSSYPLALLVLFIDGIAVCCLNVAMNAQGAALEEKFSRTTMAKLHATFSGGTFVAALISSGINSFSSSLMVHFGIAIVALLALIGYSWPALLTDDAPVPAAEGAPKEKSRLSWPTRVTVWLGLAMVFGTITEGAMNDWSSLYLRDVTHASPEIAPLGIAVVSAMMVLARLFADRWRDRWGDQRVVLTGATLAGVGLVLALLIGGVTPALLGFACVGIGMAAVTPCVYVAAAREGANALTLVAAMGTVGLLAGPPVIGFITNATTLVWGMTAVAASALLVTACVSQTRQPGGERLTEAPAG